MRLQSPKAEPRPPDPRPNWRSRLSSWIRPTSGCSAWGRAGLTEGISQAGSQCQLRPWRLTTGRDWPGSARTMTILGDLRRGAAWPLRRLGLEPGRALANAQPSPAEVQAGRPSSWPSSKRLPQCSLIRRPANAEILLALHKTSRAGRPCRPGQNWNPGGKSQQRRVWRRQALTARAAGSNRASARPGRARYSCSHAARRSAERRRPRHRR